ncbi:hypothetical protein ES703_118914 [subsurface metagenome]
MRDDRERLLDIQEAIDRINKYAARGREAFEKDELIQNWIVHHLQILGEAAARISEDFQSSNPDIPWSKIIGMRNILVHDYFGIDIDVVWSVIEKDLPGLERNVKNLLK